MKIILKQEVEGLGKTGDVKNVKDGYARNFLFPKGLALAANENNLKIVEKEKNKILSIVKKKIDEAQEYAKKLSAVSVTIPVEVGEDNKVFGSVTPSDISDALKVEGFEIDKKSIIYEDNIKELGAFEVSVKVHPEVIAKIKVWVVKKDK
ncbi:MAG: 50S ribosomal protein L9 [Elusimicrobia bacterium]|nr:50S ribosomal protein L9 [Elusimicrobiota bacterium]